MSLVLDCLAFELQLTVLAPRSGVQCLQQAQGSSYMTNYIVLFLISLGMTDVFSVVMIRESSWYAWGERRTPS